jgi:hypothetical protein
MECYSTIKKELLMHTVMWMNLRMQSKPKRQKSDQQWSGVSVRKIKDILRAVYACYPDNLGVLAGSTCVRTVYRVHLTTCQP